jgi:hypothetical protein
VEPRRRSILTVSLAALLGATASAQEEARDPGSEPGSEPPAERAAPAREAARPEGDPQQDRQISLQVELRPWYTALGGTILLPGETRGGREIDVEHLNLDSPRISPAGRVRLEVDEWSFTLSGATFATDRRAISPVARPIGDFDLREGDAVHTELRYTTAELMVGNTFFQRSLHAYDYPESRFALELEAGLGVRFDHFDVQLEREAGGEADANEYFLMPQAGIEARLKPSPRTTIAFAATAAWNRGLSDRSAASSDLIVRAAWQVTPRMQAMAGYRISIQRMEAGSGAERFEFNGSNAGLFLGLRVGF